MSTIATGYSNSDIVVRTGIFTRSHKGTKEGLLKICRILFVISVASCETGLFTKTSRVDHTYMIQTALSNSGSLRWDHSLPRPHPLGRCDLPPAIFLEQKYLEIIRPEGFGKDAAGSLARAPARQDGLEHSLRR